MFFAISVEKSALADKSEPFDTIIVGGGIAGLTTAFSLRNFNIKLLEKKSQVGGRTFSGDYKGFSYARGTEYIGKPEGILKKIINQLNLKLREIPYPADIHYDNGKFYYGEMGKALMLTKRSSLSEYNRFLKIVQKTYRDYEDVPELDMKSKVAQLDKITARQWFEQNKFSRIYIDTYNVTFKGLFGATIDEISALSALTEMAFDYEGSEQVEDIDDLKNTVTPYGDGTGMYAFDKGISEIPLGLARYLKDKVQVDTTVTKIMKKGEMYKVFYLNEKKEEHFYKAYTVILATPAAISIAIGEEVLSNEQKEIMNKVEYAPYLTVALFSGEPIFNKGFDLALPDGSFFTDIYDSTWIERYYNYEPRNKKTWITTIYIAPRTYKDRSILAMTDETIMSKIYEHLNIFLPGSREKVQGFEINRFSYAYPVMTLGTYHRLTNLHKITKNGLYLAGDYMTYPTFEAAVVSGELAAEKAIQWLEED